MEYIAAKKAEGHGMRNLNDEAAQWRSPTDDSRRGGAQDATKRKEGGHTVNLQDQVMSWNPPADQAPAWPGPAARDHKGTNSVEHVTVNSTGSMHLDQLPNFVEHCFHLPSSPDQPIAAGAMSSTDGPNSNQPSAKRRLNPIFVEALMRWPTGLSGFERQETAWTRWQLAQHSYLSALYSGYSTPETEAQGSLF